MFGGKFLLTFNDKFKVKMEDKFYSDLKIWDFSSKIPKTFRESAGQENAN